MDLASRHQAQLRSTHQRLTVDGVAFMNMLGGIMNNAWTLFRLQSVRKLLTPDAWPGLWPMRKAMCRVMTFHTFMDVVGSALILRGHQRRMPAQVPDTSNALRALQDVHKEFPARRLAFYNTAAGALLRYASKLPSRSFLRCGDCRTFPAPHTPECIPKEAHCLRCYFRQSNGKLRAHRTSYRCSTCYAALCMACMSEFHAITAESEVSKVERPRVPVPNAAGAPSGDEAAVIRAPSGRRR